MKTFIVACVLVFGTAVAMPAQEPFQYSWVGTRAPIETKLVKGQPYSAEIANDSEQRLVDGNRIVQRSTGRVYRDREGRVRREDDRAGGSSVSITDPVTSVSYQLDPTTRVARETPSAFLLDSTAFRLIEYVGAVGGLTAGGAVGARGRGSDGGRARNTVEENLPDRMIEGVSATGIRRTTTIEAGAVGNEQPIKIVSEEWKSPELQVLLLTDFSDPRTGRSTYKLTKIVRADPDPALFQVPADYTVQRGRGVSPVPTPAGAPGTPGGRGRRGGGGGQ